MGGFVLTGAAMVVAVVLLSTLAVLLVVFAIWRMARQLLAGKNGKRANGAVHAETEPLVPGETTTADR